MTFVPLWVVLWRRCQSGVDRAAAAERNAAWTPPPPWSPRRPRRSMVMPRACRPRARTVWFDRRRQPVVCVRRRFGDRDRDVHVSRTQAARPRPRALDERGVTLGPQWRVLPVPDDGSGGPHEFVATRRRRSAASSSSASICPSRDGTCAWPRSKATSPSARKSGRSSSPSGQVVRVDTRLPERHGPAPRSTRTRRARSPPARWP